MESATADGFLTGSSTDPQTDNGIVTTGISGLLSGMGTNTQAFSIQFETLNYATTANKTSVFAAFFTTGAWVYNASPERLAGKRVSVNYSVADPVTNKSKSYSSRSGDQTGNTFTVNTITQIAAKPGEDASAKIKMTFSCKLYPLDGVGAALTFTNVEAVLNIANTL